MPDCVAIYDAAALQDYDQQESTAVKQLANSGWWQTDFTERVQPRQRLPGTASDLQNNLSIVTL